MVTFFRVKDQLKYKMQAVCHLLLCFCTALFREIHFRLLCRKPTPAPPLWTCSAPFILQRCQNIQDPCIQLKSVCKGTPLPITWGQYFLCPDTLVKNTHAVHYSLWYMNTFYWQSAFNWIILINVAGDTSTNFTQHKIRCWNSEKLVYMCAK